MTPLRILLVGDYPADPRLGSPKVLFKLATELGALGHHVSLMLGPDLGARPSQRHARDLASPFLAARAVASALADGARPFDVVDASSAEGLILSLRRTHAKAVVARSHGLEHLNYHRMLEDARAGLTARPLYRRIWYPLVRMRMVEWSIRSADKLIVLNDGDRAFAAERGWKQAEDIHVVPHGLSPAFLEAASPELRVDDLLFCGSWDRVKGIDYLARAFEMAVERRPAARLTVLGPGHAPEQVLSSFAPDVRGNVAVHDRVPEDVTSWIYRRHKALVFCSTYEGYGMVLPEAMSQGLPVIATPVGSARSLVRDGETGLLVPIRDAGSLAAAMVRLLDDAALRERLASAARQQMVHRTWRTVARETADVYERALERQGRSPRA